MFGINSVKTIRRETSFIVCIISYIIALGISISTGYFLHNLLHPLLLVFVVDLIATFVIYFISLVFQNTSLYDPYWSIIPIVIAIYWFIVGAIDIGFKPTQLIILIIIGVWGIRLTYNWVRGWRGLKHEDWRYSKYRKEKPHLFWFINLIGLQLMPTIVVFLGCTPLLPSMTKTIESNNIFYIIGIIIATLAIFIETLADEQLYAFNKNKKEGDLLNTGLWGLTRHPNYFGEISFWWGLYFIGLAADISFWWTFAGPLAITLLFLIVSIPLMESRLKEHYPDFIEYKKKVSMIIPWFRKK